MTSSFGDTRDSPNEYSDAREVKEVRAGRERRRSDRLDRRRSAVEVVVVGEEGVLRYSCNSANDSRSSYQKLGELIE